MTWPAALIRASSLRTSTERRIRATSIVTTMVSTTALAAADGYWSTPTSSYSAPTTDAEPPPLMTLMTKKSPMTIDTTKIDPSAMPFLESGNIIIRMMSERLAPASRAASTTRLSMRAMALKIGTIMKIVSWCT